MEEAGLCCETFDSPRDVKKEAYTRSILYRAPWGFYGIRWFGFRGSKN